MEFTLWDIKYFHETVKNFGSLSKTFESLSETSISCRKFWFLNMTVLLNFEELADRFLCKFRISETFSN